MKKAKIMLFVIGVLAVVGGALAFKAKTAQKPLLCYTTLLPADGKCFFATNATITDQAHKQFDAFYSTEQIPAGVDPDVFCTTINCVYGSNPFKVNP